MAFVNTILEEEVAYGFEGGPAYSTNEVKLENGLRHPDSAWMYPEHRYSAELEDLPDDARDSIIALFHVMRGKRHNFKMRDYNDYKALDEPLNVPEAMVGTLEPVQLYKTYTRGPAYLIRPVYAVQEATIYLDDVPVAGTVDTETAMFYPAAPWVAGDYTWSGFFYVWVHFTSDYNAFTVNGWRAHTAAIELEEEKRRITATNVPLSWEE